VQVNQISTSPVETAGDAIVVGVFSDAPLDGAARVVNESLGALIARLIEQKEITGKRYECTPLLGPSRLAARMVLVVGLGPQATFDAGAAFRCAGAAAKFLSTKQRQSVSFFLDQAWSLELVEAALCGILVGCQGQDLYRKEKCRFPFQELNWSGGDAHGFHSGQVLAESVNLARRLVNEPPDEIYPEAFANRASQVASESGLEIEIWDQTKLEAERCGSLLAVAKGSSREPRLVILRYQGGAAGAPQLAIIGKGVTFDSGGLSIKPTDGMLTMKCDMAGAATMLAAMSAIARLKLPVNVIGLAGLVENMLGPAAMKLGDVLHARSGKTIEVHNTDAEGRLVLADVLAVAVDQKPARLVDLATLTGACVIALGTEVAGLMSNDQPWCDSVATAARACGEPVWQLPMYPDIYDEVIRSEVADIKNVGDGRWGGAISAAKFLEQFVGGVPWTHIDIAGPAFRDKPKPWCDAGATGVFVRTLVELARGLKE